MLSKDKQLTPMRLHEIKFKDDLMVFADGSWA